MKYPAVFLDRDGVLNQVVLRNGKPHPPKSVAELKIMPNAVEAVRQFKEWGRVPVVVTNQPDVARGTQTRAEVEAINAMLARTLDIDHFVVCYHDNRDNCNCRKPKPGMLVSSAQALDLDLSRSYLIGDRWRDVDAGKAAGVKTIWLDFGYSERPAEGYDYKAGSLADAVEWIGRRLEDAPTGDIQCSL